MTFNGTRQIALGLADLHLDALYERDDAGFLTASRDPEVPLPPFHLVRTPGGNRWRLRAGLSTAPRERLGRILSVQPLPSDAADAQAHAPDLAAIRAALLEDAPRAHEYRGPAFFFPDRLPALDGAELLTDPRQAPGEGPFAWLRSAVLASHPIVIVRAEGGDVASVCYSARLTSEAAEAGVETQAQYRQRGYGAAAVLRWAVAVRRTGRVPLYSTEWENAASRALASRLGLLWYAEDLHIG